MKKIYFLLMLVMVSVGVWGQTNPAAQSLPYTQNFGTATFTTMPVGWAAWNGINGGTVNTQALAEASAPTGNATLAAQTGATTTGGAFGLANASNARPYVQTSSNATNGVNQLAVAISTTGLTNINVLYDVEIISAQPRTVGIVMQYRVGTSGSWTTVASSGNPYSQAGGTTGVKANVNLTLPAGADNQAVVQLRWATWRGTEAGNSSGIAIDNISISGTSAVTPTVDISTPGTGASTENQGASNVVLQRYDLAVTDAPATLNGWTLTAAGTYVAADLVNFKVRYSTDATLDALDATLSTKVTALGPGVHVFTPFTGQSIATGTTGYIFITADISATATPGNTIHAGPQLFSDISFSGTVNKTGVDPVAAGGDKTFAALAPDIAISGASPVAGSINQNSNNNILYGLQLVVTTNNATLTGITFTTGGTYVVGDLKANSFKLWINSTNSLTGATQLGTDQAIVTSGNTVSFTGLSSVINSGTTRYLLLTADVAFNATAGNIISIASTPFSSIVFASGNKTGTDPVAAGNDQTIAAVTPLITITQTGPVASAVANGAANAFLYQWNAAVTANTAVLNSVSFTTAGTYIVSDLVVNSFKLWFNSVNNFGTATQISNTAIVTSGSAVNFTGLTQQIAVGATGFFWVTADIDANATGGNTINITSTPFSNIVFASATLSGTDPMAAGGVRTIEVVPGAGEVVINQVNPGYAGSSDEYIELVNKTNKSFDLSALRISYQSASGGGGGAGGNLSGTLLPYSYWLLSPNATVTVGLTTGLARDGNITAGFAAASGQLALQVISTGNNIDAVGYGTITGGTNTEGTAASSPSSNSGLKRNEGDDTNDNSVDFSSVAATAIDLRNSSSRLAQTGAIIDGATYTRLLVKGNSSSAGNIVLTDRAELLSGQFTLGSNNLTVANTVEGGSSTSYIRTNGTGVLTVNNITTGKTLPIGNAKYNPLIIENGSGHNWTAKVDDGITADGGFTTDKAVLVTWDITPSVNPTAAPADITFQFDEAATPTGQTGVNFSTGTNVQAWRRPSGAWLTTGAPAAVNTTVPNAATVKILGLSNFSPFGLSSIDGPLPVKFGNVKAYQQGNGIKVDWSNLTESGVVNYTIERSANGQLFTPLGTVNPTANNSNRADYSYFDAAPLTGINFYRIQSLEVDGKKLFSTIVRVSTKAGQTDITIYPNPVSGNRVSFQATALPKGQYMVRVTNAAGQQVMSKSLLHTGGSVTEVLELPATIKTGMYNILLSGADIKLTKTFIIR